MPDIPRVTSTGKLIRGVEATRNMDFPYPPEDIPQEVECGHCNGTGKVMFCPLCKGSGIVREHKSWEGGGCISMGKPCPNRCPKQEARL